MVGRAQRSPPPGRGGRLLGCAAVCNASITVQRLAVEAAVSGDDLLLRQAMLMDPLVGAVCNPPEVWQLVDEMLIAQENGCLSMKQPLPQPRSQLG